MKMEYTVCSETSAYKFQAPGNYPEECIQHSEHGESLKSINIPLFDHPSKTGIGTQIVLRLTHGQYCTSSCYRVQQHDLEGIPFDWT
jgi:hypothetical protein